MTEQTIKQYTFPIFWFGLAIGLITALSAKEGTGFYVIGLLFFFIVGMVVKTFEINKEKPNASQEFYSMFGWIGLGLFVGIILGIVAKISFFMFQFDIIETRIHSIVQNIDYISENTEGLIDDKVSTEISTLSESVSQLQAFPLFQIQSSINQDVIDNARGKIQSIVNTIEEQENLTSQQDTKLSELKFILYTWLNMLEAAESKKEKIDLAILWSELEQKLANEMNDSIIPVEIKQEYTGGKPEPVTASALKTLINELNQKSKESNQ